MSRLFACILILASCGIASPQMLQSISNDIHHSPSAAIPKIIQARGTPSDVQAQATLNGTGTFNQVCLQNATQVGDKILVLDINNQTSTANTVVTDDGSNTYSIPSGASQIAGGRMIAWHVATVSTPSHCITDTYGSTGTATDNELIVIEVNNVGAVDVTCAATVTSGTAPACSSMTTTQNGDFIITGANVVSFSSTPTGNMTWTAQTGTPTESLFSASGTDWAATQYAIQSTAGAITPSLTVSSAVTRANVVGLALKAASGGGSIPSTVWLRSVQSRNNWGYSNASTSTTQAIQFPCTGNDPWLLTGNIDGVTISSVTDNNGNTWTGLGDLHSTGDGFRIQWFHITSASPVCNANEVITIHYSGDPSGQDPIAQLYDVMNSAGQDSSATCSGKGTALNGACNVNNSENANPPVNFGGGTITPTSASSAHPELILSYQNQDFDTISGVSPGTFMTFISVCPNSGGGGCGGSGTSTNYNYVGIGQEQDGGIMAATVTSNSAVTPTWTPQNTQSQSLLFSFSSTIAIKSQ